MKKGFVRCQHWLGYVWHMHIKSEYGTGGKNGSAATLKKEIDCLNEKIELQKNAIDLLTSNYTLLIDCDMDVEKAKLARAFIKGEE